MAGPYPNPPTNKRYSKYRTYLCRWIDQAIKDKVWERVDNLHIDEIAEELTDSSRWIEDSLGLYRLLPGLLKGRPYACYLGISLGWADKEIDMNALSWQYVKSHMDLTPPSFYLFPYTKSDEEYFQAPLLERLSRECGYKVFLSQEQEADGMYYRSLVIAGNNQSAAGVLNKAGAGGTGAETVLKLGHVVVFEKKDNTRKK